MDTQDIGLECLVNVAPQVSPAPPRMGVEADDTQVLPAQDGEAFQASYIPNYIVPQILGYYMVTKTAFHKPDHLDL